MRYLLLLLTILVCHNLASSQHNPTHIENKNLVELRRSLEASPTPFVLLATSRQIFSGNFIRKQDMPDNTPMVLATAQVPPAWQYENLAFFCKLEVKMEKALKMPVKIRLGEVQAVERKEGKLKAY